MGRVNRGRVLIGGIVGGVVIFAIMGLANHFCLHNDWMMWMSTVGGVLPHPDPKHSMVLWFIQSLLIGITGTALYAGIRPRYGAGSKTALWAGFVVWVLAYLTEMLNSRAMGFLPPRIIAGECIAGFVAALVGVYLGAAIYKED